MTDRSRDELADALRGLSSGEHPEGDAPEDAAPSHRADLFAAPNAPSAPPGPPSTGESTRSEPTASPSPPGQRPSAPGWGATPVRPAAPNWSSRRPPSPPTDGAGLEGGHVDRAFAQETTGLQAIDEDDQVIVPPAPLSALGHGLPGRRPGQSKYTQLEFRRTTIPILLTCGILFLVTPALGWLADPESPLGYLARNQLWLIVVLLLAGLFCLTMGVATMLQVRPEYPE